jgi:hypothetical protein
MVRGGKLLVSALLGSTLLLSACGREPQDKAKVAAVDDELTSNDPAVTGAIDDKIIVDPKLAARASAGTVARGPKAKADAEAAGKAALGGRLVAAPAAKAMEPCEECAAKKPATLGALAAEQSKGSCDAKLTYNNDWAKRLPAAFNVYPRALVREAAGVAGGKCNIRVVNFQTAASTQAVINYYHTLATRAGYTSDHRIEGAEHMLGGTKGELAYVVMLRSEGGVTDVDLVASGGR